MSSETNDTKTNEIPLAKALCEELNHIKSTKSPQPCPDTSDKKLDEVFNDFYNANLSALCFSGGGIRSATFGLGIVQALAKHKLLDNFDYLSTVSGGGYLGAWLSAWIRREQIRKFEENAPDNNETNVDLFKRYKETQNDGIIEVQKKLNDISFAKPTCPNPEPKQLQALREYSNYMSPKVGLISADTWTLLGIYTRNLFLNWTIFIPLICAILLLPRILLTVIKSNISGIRMSLLLILSLIVGIIAIFFTVDKLPKNKTAGKELKTNTDSGVFVSVILPLVVMAFAATTFWAWYNMSGISPWIPFDLFRPYLKYEFLNFVIFSVLIFFIGNSTFYIYKFFTSENYKAQGLELLTALISSAIGGCLTWLIANNFFDAAYFSDLQTKPYNLPIYICFAVPLYFLSFTTASTIFVGIYSRVATDDDREWLARQSAWLLIACGAWIALNALVLFGPLGFEVLIAAIGKLFSVESTATVGSSRWFEYLSPLVPLIAAISGLLSLVGGFSGKSLVRDEPTKSNLSKFLAVAPKIAAVIFLVFIFVSLAYVSNIVLALVGNFIAKWFCCPSFTSDAHFAVLYQSKLWYLLAWLIILSAIGIGMAFFINVNKFSLHALYRNRLIRAYLGASRLNRKGNTFTGFDDNDNFQLHRLKGQKPFHIINATLNLVAGKNLAWQDRKAASFTMSPLHCGSWLLGYRNTNEYARNTNLSPCENLRYCNQRDEPCPRLDESDTPCKDKDGKIIYGVENCKLKGKALRLGTAMTISGAAANPNMGYYSSSVVTFLMSLFNIRLGWWLGNTGKIGDKKDSRGIEFYTKPSPSVAVLPLINETFGRTDQDKRFLNITDGGHFENLGLYEMILRRCRLIVLSDAAADEQFTFGEISNAIEKCKVDLGVDIKFKDGINIYARHKAKDYADKRRRFAIAEIIYPETHSNGRNHKGYLIYLRPTIYGTEATDIQHYANANNTFPHQSTADQLYDEKQFEAYRALGFYTMEKIIGKQKPANLDELLECIREDKTQES